MAACARGGDAEPRPAVAGGQPAVHLLPYEVITEPPGCQAAMRQLCKFLRVEFNEEMLKPSVFGINGVVHTASRAEASIFRTEKAWWNGLSLRETLLAATFHGFCWLAVSARDRRPFLYRKMPARIYSEQAAQCS